MTLKAIKENSVNVDGLGFKSVDPDKRLRLLRDHYNSLIKKAMGGGEIVVKFHGVFTWSFSSPCHLDFKPSGVVSLISYETDVADYYPGPDKGSSLLYINGWYSVTTSRHIEEFRDVFGGSGDAASVAPHCWETAARNGYDLDNLEALGLGNLLADLDKVPGVFKYQRKQMAELLTAVFYDALGGDFGSFGIGKNPGAIIAAIYSDMTADNRRIYTGGGLEPWTFNNDSRNISRSWDVLKMLLGQRLKKAA